MRDFGYYSNILMLLYSVIGSSLGCAINYGIGYIFSKYASGLSISKNKFIYMLMAVLLLFTWINIVGAIICVLNGYFRVNIWYVLCVIIISNVLYYCYLLRCIILF